MRRDALERLEAALGHPFAHPELLAQALRHRSAAHEQGVPSFERLEFLGDAALSHAVASLLFKRWPNATALAHADRGALEEMIKSTGFFRNKAKSLEGMAHAVVEKHGGRVPRTMDELTALPGVGRKTANVVLGNVFGENDGVVVDTHVARLSRLMGLTRETDPVKIEQDLMRLFPREDWTMLSHLLIEHGRKVCIANRPKHDECVLRHLCPSAEV